MQSPFSCTNATDVAGETGLLFLKTVGASQPLCFLLLAALYWLILGARDGPELSPRSVLTGLSAAGGTLQVASVFLFQCHGPVWHTMAKQLWAVFERVVLRFITYPLRCWPLAALVLCICMVVAHVQAPKPDPHNEFVAGTLVYATAFNALVVVVSWLFD